MKLEIINSPFSAHDNVLFNFMHLFLVDDVVYNTNSLPYTSKKLYQLKLSAISAPCWILHNDQEFLKLDGSSVEHTFYFLPIKGLNVVKVVSIDKQTLYAKLDIETTNKDIYLALQAEQLKSAWNNLYQTLANTYYTDNLIQDLDGNNLTPEWKFTKAVGNLLGVSRYSKFTDAEYYTFLHNVFDMNFYGGTSSALYLLKNALGSWIDKIDVIPFEEYYPATDLYNKVFLTKNNIVNLYNFDSTTNYTFNSNIVLTNSSSFSFSFWASGTGGVKAIDIVGGVNRLWIDKDAISLSVNITDGTLLDTITVTTDTDVHLFTITKEAGELKIYIDGVLESTTVLTTMTFDENVESTVYIGKDSDGNSSKIILGEIQWINDYVLTLAQVLDFYTNGIVDDYYEFVNNISFDLKWDDTALVINSGNSYIKEIDNTLDNTFLSTTVDYRYRKLINNGTDDNILIYPGYMFYDRQWKKLDYYNVANADSTSKYIYVDGEDDAFDSLKVKFTADADIYKEEYLFTETFLPTDFRTDSSSGVYTGFPDSKFVILNKPNIDQTAIIASVGDKDIDLGAYYNTDSEYNIVNLMTLDDKLTSVDVTYRTYKNNQVLGRIIRDTSTYDVRNSGHLDIDDVFMGNRDYQYGSIVIVIRTAKRFDNELKNIMHLLIDNVIPAHIKWYIKYDNASWRTWGQTDLIFDNFIDPLSSFYMNTYNDFL